jgi:hypothetical protein
VTEVFSKQAERKTELERANDHFEASVKYF